MKMVKIETSFDADSGIIEQNMYATMQGYREILCRQIVNTKEAEIRQALIEMGWTPPEEPDNGG
jgi:hypothetical protein